MHPTPTRIATPPRSTAHACWNPAVPPPPVAGATEGSEVGEGLAFGEGLALGFTDWLTEALALGIAEGLTETLAETVAEAEAVPGDSFGSVALGVDPEQAASDAVATMGTMAQPATVSFAPNPVRAEVVRVVIGSVVRPADGGAFRLATNENPICCTCAQWPIHHLSITLRD
jgi:hypothetical protein